MSKPHDPCGRREWPVDTGLGEEVMGRYLPMCRGVLVFPFAGEGEGWAREPR